MRSDREYAQRTAHTLDQVNTLVAVIALVIYVGMVVPAIYFAA